VSTCRRVTTAISRKAEERHHCALEPAQAGARPAASARRIEGCMNGHTSPTRAVDQRHPGPGAPGYEQRLAMGLASKRPGADIRNQIRPGVAGGRHAMRLDFSRDEQVSEWWHL
jgi:hypothetical protein